MSEEQPNTTVQKTELENGVRVLSERMPGVRSVSVGVLVDVGSKDETSTERGYAHLLEHMLFQGTGARDAGAIAEMMEIGGGAMGAFTARDYTVYHATVLDEYLPFALEVLGDMLCNSILPADALEHQRSVVLNEISGQNDPLEQSNLLMKSALWPGHPLGYPTVGLKHTIQTASRPTLIDFMQRHYSGKKLVVAAAGNVDHASFADQTRDSFWSMSANEPPGSTAVPPDVQLGTLVAETRDTGHVYFSMAWPAPAYTDPDRYAWHVFATLFGGGPNSRLYRKLREAQGLVYHVAAEYQAYGNTGALVVEGSTLPEALVPVLAGILIELFKLGEEVVNPDDLHRVKQSLISQHLISGDSAYVRMSRLALQDQYFRRPISSDDVIAGLRAQSPDSIQQVSNTVCGYGIPTMALVGSIDDTSLAQVATMLEDLGGTPTVQLVNSNGAMQEHIEPALEAVAD